MADHTRTPQHTASNSGAQPPLLSGAPLPTPAPPPLSGASSRADAPVQEDFGGDPACWLDRVCDTCGRFVENRLADSCPYCGAARDAAAPVEAWRDEHGAS